MRGRLNYIELRVVTQCIYERAWENAEGDSREKSAERRSGIYSTTFWLRLILKNRHRQKLRAHPRAYVLARARRPYLFAPRVLRFVLHLPFLASLLPYRSRSRDFEPAFPGRNIRSEETTPYNTRPTFIVMHAEITN
jgi:hypothetical protein